MTPEHRTLLIASLRSAFAEYVGVHLAAANDEQKKLIEQMFSNHMNLIADYCEREYFEKDILTTAFIRGLHKIISPSGETLWKKNAKGELVAYMIPGQYKTEPNEAKNIDTGEVHVFEDPSETKQLMNALVEKYNSSILTSNSKEQVFEIILRFIVEFFQIHPF
jgi:Fic family protein